jgi:hypothetical protein
MRWLMLFFCLGLAACQPRPVKELPAVSASQSVAELYRLEREHHALSALADVTVTRQGKRWSVTQGVVIERPLRLRVDAINFFGQTLFQMGVDGPLLQAYVPAEKKFYTGMATLDNVQRFTGLPLALPDLVACLLYSLPPGVVESAQIIETAQGVDLVLAPGVRYETVFSSGRLSGFRYRIDDLTLYEVAFGPVSAELDFPRRIELDVPQSDTRVVIALDDIELNPVLSRQQFQLSLPATAEEVPLNEMEPVDDQTVEP